MDAARSAGPRRRAVAAASTEAGCFRARPHSITMADRRQSPIRWRSTLAGRPDGDSFAAFLATRPIRHEIRRDECGLAPERRRGRRPGASGRPGLRLHAGDQRAATFAHRAGARSKGRGPGRVVRSGQRIADRTAAELTNGAAKRPIGTRRRRFPIRPCWRSRRTASFSPTRVSGGLWREARARVVTPAPPAAR